MTTATRAQKKKLGRRQKAPPEQLDRDAWIEAARRALIKGGVATVKVAPLAQVLGITTGSFYWHFKDRSDLLDALLDDWERTNSWPMLDAIRKVDAGPQAQVLALTRIWIEERMFSPAYDSALRDWARTSAKVDAAVRRVDAARIDVLRSIFLDMGDSEADAFVRARVFYFHQVGYYALQIRETAKQRVDLLPTYLSLLLAPADRGIRRSVMNAISRQRLPPVAIHDQPE